MSILLKLAPDRALDPRWPDRVTYRGTVDDLTIEFAVGEEGIGRLTVRDDRPARLRFVHRSQVPHGRRRTGDEAFDHAVVILGGDVDVLRVGAAARAQIIAWMERARCWCTDSEVGIFDLPIEEIDAAFDAARGVLDSLDEPDVAELLTMRLQAPKNLHRAIDQRIEAGLVDGERLDPILRALTAHAPAERAHWLSRVIPRLGPHGDAVLRLLPEPPPAFDALVLGWSANHSAARALIEQRLTRPEQAARLLQLAQHDAEQLRSLCTLLPHTPWSTAQIEALDPENASARLARLAALRVRPPGNPGAYAKDLSWPRASVHTVAEEIMSVHLATWLSDPHTAVKTMIIAERFASIFIDLALKERSPVLIKALSSRVFTNVEDERRRLRALSQLPVHGAIKVRHAFSDPALVGAARALVSAHLEHWLDDPGSSGTLVDAVGLMPELSERILALCAQKPRPGAAGALRTIKPRNESERLALIKAMGETGDPSLEGTLLRWMERGYAVRMACIDALGLVGGRTALDRLQSIASGFLVEKALKTAALRACSAIEARLGGGMGGLSLAQADGRLSLDDD